MVDTHCHLDSCKDDDAELIARARQVGVTRLATIGMDGPTIERALETARAHEGVVVVAGRHPHKTEGFGPADAEAIEQAAADPLVRADRRDRPGLLPRLRARATTSGARSRRSWTSPPGWTCRWSSTPARPRTTRSRSWPSGPPT